MNMINTNILENNKYIGLILDVYKNFEKNIFFIKKIYARSFSFYMLDFLKNYIYLKKDFFLNFRNLCKKYHFKNKYIIPHSSYFINIAHPIKNILYRNIKAFIKEISICFNLGLKFLNFHLGFHLNMISEIECINIVINSINYIINKTKKVILLIENTCGSGTSIGSNLEQISIILSSISNKSRIGICLDICHIFSFGYKLSTFTECEDFFYFFDKIIGLKYLRAIHLSESKYPCSSKKDRHISLLDNNGYIGKIFFHWFMKNKLFNNKAIILETRNIFLWEKEIIWLYSLI